MTRHKNSFPLFNVKHEYSKNSFFHSTITEWNNLDSNIRNSESLALYKKRILTFIRPSANSTLHCHNSNGLKLIASLRLGLSHLLFHNFKYTFCICGTVKTTIHYLLHCPNFSNEILTLLNKVQSIDENILRKNDSNFFSKTLLLVITHLMM